MTEKVELGAVPFDRGRGGTAGPGSAVVRDDRLRRIAPLLAATAVSTVLLGLAVIAALGRSEVRVRPSSVLRAAAADPVDASAAATLERHLRGLQPSGVHVIIDSARNRLRVCRGTEVLREAVCSTGTGTVLVDPRDQRTWVFDSPVGVRRVVRKVRNPVWSKPDWAFIEEGFEPPGDPSLRIDTFSLGDFALYLGEGYIIHGTIFQTLLGRPATHGCVRLGDDDLRYVYEMVPVGAHVLLY